MSLGKVHIWADLRYALDELNRPPLDISRRLTDAANLDAQHEKEAFNRMYQVAEFSSAYLGARMRAETRIAHEAIEKGLKAILLDSGLSQKCVRSRGHRLDLLLEDVELHNRTAFVELERCFDSTIQHLEVVATTQHITSMLEYFREHGKAEVFVVNRYASIEDTSKPAWGMIGVVYMEIIRALSSLVCGWTPTDIDHRIERATRKAVLAESNRDPVWDAYAWIEQGLVRPRLEVIGNLENNRVLHAALRRCAKEHKHRDWGIWSWADHVRRNYITTVRRMRQQRVG